MPVPLTDPIATPPQPNSTLLSSPSKVELKPITQAPVEQVNYRKFGDHTSTRNSTFSNVLNSVTNIKPVENNRFKLEIANPHYESDKEYSALDHKKALLTDQTLGRRLMGELRLIDKETNQVVDAKKTTLANVPYLTKHGDYVIGGVPMVLASQPRLMEGIYVHKKDNGIPEAHVNVAPGKGVTHRIQLNPETSVFRVHVGQAEIPLVAYMKANGFSDDEIKNTLGPTLAPANYKAYKPHHIDKLWEKFGNKYEKADTFEDRLASLNKIFSQYEFDPWVSRRTLGRPHKNLSKDVIATTINKIIGVHKNEVDPDDRDSLVFQKVWSPEHLIAERVARSEKVLKDMLWKATNKKSLKSILPGVFDDSINNLFLNSGIGQNPEGISAAEFIDHGSRLTKIGEGGLSRSSDAVPKSARDVSASYFAFVDPVKATESESTGLDLRTAFGVRIGSDKRLYAPLMDSKANRLVYRSPQDLHDTVIAFPVTYERAAPDDYVPVIKGGKLDYELKSKVKYVVPTMEQTFSPLTNMVPLKSGVKGQRASMGARMIAQALPIKDAEAPLVRAATPDDPNKSFEELYGKHMGPVFAEEKSPGVVKSISNDEIVVQYQDGTTKKHELYHHLPSGRKSSLTNTPLVKEGDVVQPGQILAKSNYTDDKGHAAYGHNVRVALMPYIKGDKATYEDAIVVSESAAKRMSSDHLYRHDFDFNDESVIKGKQAYMAYAAGKHPPEFFEKYDDDGVAKPGVTINPGEPIVLAVKRREGGYGVGKSRRAGLADGSMTWDYDNPGEVVDVYGNKGKSAVTVKTTRPIVSGDKVSGRYGNKGVVHVVPDHEMYTDEEGKPFDVIMTSLGTTSRINPGGTQLEVMLGKLAQKIGKPIIFNDFKGRENHAADVLQMLQQHGLSPTETIVDPTTGIKTPNIATGVTYLMKLHHMADDKVKARGLGSYDEAGVPIRGASGKASRMSMGDTMALMGHSAYEVLKDARYYRGQNNEEFWMAYQGGYEPSKNVNYRQYDRFLSYLKAAGIDPEKKGTQTHLKPLTPTKVKELAGDREVTVPQTVDAFKDNKPIKGGLLDPDLFGDPNTGSEKWAKITLPEAMPNPVFEEPIRKLFDITEEKYRNVLAGKDTLNGVSGPQAFAKALQEYDVTKELEQARRDFHGSKKTLKDKAAKKMQYLKAFVRTGSHPSDWLTEAVPVIPPSFRPVKQMMGSNSMVVSDSNLLYADLINANNAFKEIKDKVSDTADERLTIYDAMKAAYGLGDPVNPKNAGKNVKGILKQVFGDSAKRSYVQQKLLGTPVDLSARGVVLPNPSLNMDEMGVPVSAAWDMFQPFVIRRLVRQGVGRIDALRMVMDKNEMATKALEEEMKDRPVIATRYPVLHKYNTQAFHAKLVPGSSFHSNPAVNKVYALDHDGDTMSIHVPLSDAAVKDAKEKMLPSKNLYSPGTFKATNFLPNMEFVAAIHYLSSAKDETEPVYFKSRQDVIKALQNKEIKPSTPVIIGE